MKSTIETSEMPVSELVKNQKQVHGPKHFVEGAHGYKITATVRHDDQCGNGHNSFSITGEVTYHGREERGGCLHDEIAKHFPHLAPFIKWHLTSTDGPMHYVANTLYWLGHSGYCDGEKNSPPNLEYARSTAVWPDMPESFVADPQVGHGTLRAHEQREMITAALLARLPGLMAAFKADVEKLGLKY